MATLGVDVRDWLLNNVLVRTDISTMVLNFAVDNYRIICSKVPFEGLYAASTSTPGPCVVGQSAYSLPSDLAGIISYRIHYTTNQRQRLRKSSMQNFDAMSVATNSRPTMYARVGTGVELYPPPNDVYTTNLRYWKQADINATPANTTILMPEAWFPLLRWMTLHDTYIGLKQPMEAGTLMMINPQPKMPSPKGQVVYEPGVIPRLWNDLLTTIEEREAIDDNFGLYPQDRRYTPRA